MAVFKKKIFKRVKARDPPTQVLEQDCHLGCRPRKPSHFCLLLPGAQEDPNDSDILTIKRTELMLLTSESTSEYYQPVRGSRVLDSCSLRL